MRFFFDMQEQALTRAAIRNRGKDIPLLLLLPSQENRFILGFGKREMSPVRAELTTRGSELEPGER